MARRISLPSSDELFGERGPYAGSAPQAPVRARKGRPSRSAASPPRAKRGQSRPRLIARIDRVEKRLRDLPIDSLIELRDSLEGLLLGGTLSEADVERVLSATER